MRNLLPPTLLRLFAQSAPDNATRHTVRLDIRPALLSQLGLDQQLAARLLDHGALPHGFRYRHFTVPKRDGSNRELVEPGSRLKAIQRVMVELLRNNQPHRAAIGFRRGLSIADHAWAHAGASMIITADIKDFFSSTTSWRIAAWWKTQGYTDDETRLLTRLTTYHKSLPQGAPTSPSLSNFVNVELDAALERMTRQSAGTYTRYADDLAFSWPDGYGPPIHFEQMVRAQLRERGYELHPEKGWQLWQRRDEPEITGLILTKQGQVDLPQSIHKTMRTLARSQHPHDRQRFAGFSAYRAMINRKQRR